MATQSQLKERFSLDIPAHLEADGELPVLSGRQRQGDIYIVPANDIAPGKPVPAEGVVLVKGEAMGNTHLLLQSEVVACRTFEPDPNSLKVAEVTVDEGAQAFIHHIEHGYIGIAPGSYIVKRQREQADEIRLVAD